MSCKLCTQEGLFTNAVAICDECNSFICTDPSGRPDGEYHGYSCGCTCGQTVCKTHLIKHSNRHSGVVESCFPIPSLTLGLGGLSAASALKYSDRPNEQDVEPLNDLLNIIYPGFNALSQTNSSDYKIPFEESLEQETFRFEPSFFKGQTMEKVMTIAAKVTGYSWNTIRNLWNWYNPQQYSYQAALLSDALGSRLYLLETLANRFKYSNISFNGTYIEPEKVISIVNRKFSEKADEVLSDYLPYVINDYRLPENREQVATWLADTTGRGNSLTMTA